MSVRAGPHAPLGDGVDLVAGFVAPCGHARQELIVAARNLRLQERARLLAEGPVDAQLTREGRGAHPVDGYADLAERLVDGRDDGEDADGTGEGRRGRPDFVRGGGNEDAPPGRTTR